MSAEGTFLLNVERPDALFDALVKAWSARTEGRHVVMQDRTGVHPGFQSAVHLSENEASQIEDMLQRLTPKVNRMVEELATVWGGTVFDSKENKAPQTAPKAIVRKRWECRLSWIFGSEDEPDFLESANTIIKMADGDVLYFRAVEAVDDGDARRSSDIEITLGEIHEYLPNMSDFRRYVLKSR